MAIVLKCRCGLPFARVENGAIIIESRHHGERHVGVISIDELVRMCEAEREPDRGKLVACSH